MGVTRGCHEGVMKVSSSPGSDSDDSDPSRGAENPFQVGKRSFWGAGNLLCNCASLWSSLEDQGERLRWCCHVVLTQEISRVDCKLSRLEPTSSTKHAFIAFPPGFSMWWVCRHLWLSCGVRALGKASSEQTLLVAEILQQFLMILVEVLSSRQFKPGTVQIYQIYQQTFRPGIDLFSPFRGLPLFAKAWLPTCARKSRCGEFKSCWESSMASPSG